MTYDHPSPEQAGVYEELEALGIHLDADVSHFYTAIADPRKLPQGLKNRVGTGFCVPGNPPPPYQMAEADHFRSFAPNRFSSLIALLRGLTGDSERAILERNDVQTALGYSRLIQAWAPDLLVSYYGQEQSLCAFVAAHLLDIPHVLVVSWIADDGRFAKWAALFVATATLIGLGSQELFEQAIDKFGADIRNRLVMRHANALGVPTMAERMQGILSVPRGADLPLLGPRAAFVGAGHAAAECPAGVKPFLVLGAERTGSNLLVGALASQSQITCAGELFNPRLIQEGVVAWLPGVAHDGEELNRLRAADPGKLHDRLLADGAGSGAAWVGFKLLYYHGVVDGRILDHLAAIPGLKIVHLLRQDRLRRYLSHHKARFLDSWYAAAGSEQGPQVAPLALDVTEALMDFAYVELMEERYRATFDRADMIELDYEQFSIDLSQTGRKLGDFFGLALGALKATSKKTGSSRHEEGIANLAELREALVGTRWESLLVS